jgi:hypothetical protein
VAEILVMNFGNFDLKTVFLSANGGGGGGGGGGCCRKFESFVGNFGGFAPPPEKVNFRHLSTPTSTMFELGLKQFNSVLDWLYCCVIYCMY